MAIAVEVDPLLSSLVDMANPPENDWSALKSASTEDLLDYLDNIDAMMGDWDQHRKAVLQVLRARGEEREYLNRERKT